jgi:hypothetical protein
MFLNKHSPIAPVLGGIASRDCKNNKKWYRLSSIAATNKIIYKIYDQV